VVCLSRVSLSFHPFLSFIFPLTHTLNEALHGPLLHQWKSHGDDVSTLYASNDPLSRWYVPLVSLSFHLSPSFIFPLTHTLNEALHGPLLHQWKSHGNDVSTLYASNDPLSRWYVPLVSLSFHLSPSFIFPLTHTLNEALHGPLLHQWKSHGNDVSTLYASNDPLSRWYVSLVSLSFLLSPSCVNRPWLSLIPMYAL
jgi:hypothetical protein